MSISIVGVEGTGLADYNAGDDADDLNTDDEATDDDDGTTKKKKKKARDDDMKDFKLTKRVHTWQTVPCKAKVDNRPTMVYIVMS